MRQMKPRLAMINAISEELNLIGYYVFSTETKITGRQAGTRMFAPRFGIDEEAATGMAAGPLACFLHDRLGLKQDEIQIEQGYLMSSPSPSVIRVKLNIEEGKVVGLMAGGSARVMQTLPFEFGL